MRRRTLVVAVGLVLAATGARAAEPDAAALVVRLRDADVDVRAAAAVALLSLGAGARAALEAPQASRAGDRSEAAVEEAERLLGTLRVVERMAARPRDSVGFWMDVEEVVDREAGARRRAAVAAGLAGEPGGRPGSREAAAEDVLVRRDGARAFVHEHGRDLRQSYAVGSPEEASNARLEKGLEDLGASAAPHLLRVLAANPYKAFVYAVPGAPATAQVAAVLGVARGRLRAAVAHLVYQAAISPSFTAATNAASALEPVAGAKIARPDDTARDAVLAWWDAHRAEHAESLRWLLTAVLADLRADAARLAAGFPDAAEGGMGGVHEPAAALAKALPRIAGPGFPLVWEGDAAARLASVRAAEAWVEKTLGR